MGHTRLGEVPKRFAWDEFLLFLLAFIAAWGRHWTVDQTLTQALPCEVL
jgi:hypothetical protein